jgi:signal transduction histidine kinase
VLLLRASAKLPLPDWALGRVRFEEPPRARALLERLVELDPSHGPVAAQLAAELEATVRRRALLRVASAALPRVVAAAETAVVEEGGYFVVYSPARGAGACLPLAEREALLASLGLRAAEPGWLQPATFTLLLAALAAMFGLGLWFLLRSLRREAEALRARAEFLTSVTHELKTPLASIRLLAEMLASVEEHKREEYLAMLDAEAARLSALVENVLDLGRVERGERGYDRRRHSLPELVRAVLRSFEPIARRSGLDLQLDEAGGELFAAVDHGAIAQALLNVLENARKYAPGGGKVAVATAREGDRFVLRVRDHGPGVPEAEREAIFERFRRGQAQQDGSVPGLGLGLYLARKILRDHGGEMRCEAPVDGGRGAVFVLELPVLQEVSA